MVKGFSLEMQLDICDDECGARITVGDDRDGLDLTEICSIDEKGKIHAAIVLNDEQRSLLIEALQHYQQWKKGSVNEMRRAGLAALAVTQEDKRRDLMMDWQHAVATGATLLGLEAWVALHREGQSSEPSGT
jgi:hypothetical protein